MRLRTPVLAAATAGVLGGLVVGGSVLTGVTAQPVGSASSRSVPAAAPDDADDGTDDSEGLERRCRPHGLRGPGGPADGLGEKLSEKLSGTLPEKLVEDLSGVRELPAGEERREALEKIWDAALAGDYGEQVQQLAERRREHRAEGRAGRHGGPGAGVGGGVGGPLGALRDQLPDELRADLQELRELSPAERREAMQEIWEAAKAGDYGAEARELAQQLAEKRDDYLDRLPAELRADLQELRELSPAERREAMQEIWEAAKAGDYGAEAQELAEKLAERRAEHRQHRQERCGDTGGTEAPDDSSASPSTT